LKDLNEQDAKDKAIKSKQRKKKQIERQKILEMTEQQQMDYTQQHNILFNPRNNNPVMRLNKILTHKMTTISNSTQRQYAITIMI